MAASAELLTAIVKHIFVGLGLYGSVPISICQELFLLGETIGYVDSVQLMKSLEAPIWALETTIEDKKFSIVCSRFIFGKQVESYVILKLQDNPAYGCFLGSDGAMFYDGFVSSELKKGNWAPVNNFLGATLLAGMEQVRELAAPYSPAADPKELLGLLKSFIRHRETTMEITDEEIAE